MKYKKTSDLLKDNIRFGAEEIQVKKFESYPTHYHNHFEIYFLLSDKAKYLINDEIYDIKRNNLVLIKPFDLHKTYVPKNTLYHRILINADQSMFGEEEKPLLACFEKSGVYNLNEAQTPRVRSLITRITDACGKKDSFAVWDFKALLTELLVYINRHLTGSLCRDARVEAAKPDKITRIMAYIQKNYDSEITLTCLSEKFGLSPYYISRLFRNKAGITFSAYLNGIRIKEAQKLISQSRLSITEAALSVGFDSASHFGKIFKKTVGISPREYKKRMLTPPLSF